jgi:dTDP-4-amino-4,6-dideoxygalactose transaminase
LLEKCLKEKANNNTLLNAVDVHLFGQNADMDPISLIGKKYDIPIIEDVA